MTVVGPDDPYGDLTADDTAQAHWEYLAEHLPTQGVAARAAETSRLQHDVELSQRLRARLGRP